MSDFTHWITRRIRTCTAAFAFVSGGGETGMLGKDKTEPYKEVGGLFSVNVKLSGCFVRFYFGVSGWQRMGEQDFLPGFSYCPADIMWRRICQAAASFIVEWADLTLSAGQPGDKGEDSCTHTHIRTKKSTEGYLICDFGTGVQLVIIMHFICRRLSYTFKTQSRIQQLKAPLKKRKGNTVITWQRQMLDIEGQIEEVCLEMGFEGCLFVCLGEFKNVLFMSLHLFRANKIPECCQQVEIELYGWGGSRARFWWKMRLQHLRRFF